MGFVKTPDELERIQAALIEPHFFSAQTLSVEFLTRPEIVRSVLPPGLEPIAEPIAVATVGRYGRSNCVHAFAGGALYVRARHGDVVGDYCLSMPMSSDRAIIFGRELYGEPKKLASVSLVAEGSRMRGQIDRYGHTIIGVQAELTAEHPPSEGRRRAFHYKFFPSASGRGLEDDPWLVLVTFDTKLSRIATGTGSLHLGQTVHDPLAEIEIVRVRSVSYTEGDIYASAQTVARVSAKEFLPYAYGKVDDWTHLDNEKRAPWGDVNQEAV